MLERQSRNTYENAVFSKAMIAPKPGERWLLVTSAYHMPRSVGLFRKAGFPVEPYPVDWRVGHRPRASTAFRCWVCGGPTLPCASGSGLLAYRLRGRIDDLFPGPT